MSYRIERWTETGPPDAAKLTQKMRSEGYSVFQWSDPAGAVYPEHEHSDDQSHWIISGTLEISVEGLGRIELRTGDRDFMPVGTVHSARVLGEIPVVYLIGAKEK